MKPDPPIHLDPHRYTEASARARLARRRSHGEELVMREIDGHWYTGRRITLGEVLNRRKHPT